MKEILFWITNHPVLLYYLKIFNKIFFYPKLSLKFHLTQYLQISFEDEIYLWSWTRMVEAFQIIHQF